MNYQNYKTLSDSELSEVNGGFVPAVIGWGVGLYFLKDGWTHTDQIVKGIKKGWG
ncbi:lactococcin family bacteriocin [Leuconostoc rapi]|uniref:lactococcin family bacteriocin n=1 Tax=Leuconostoc rapi TaxID=1406906 RepID=UPI00195E26CC|nr:lactococcin family bacteriocin [Leuconostoc rapi]MBM7436409.1 bacteriocin-like protein [Leuconostoc rapi]